MAPKLQRFVSPGKGNGLRATARIGPGELVYAAEPLASCVSGQQSRNVCHQCFTRRETLLRCSQCKMARYCSATCQRQAWPGHKRECPCLKSVLPRVPTDSVRLAARLIFATLGSSRSSSEELYTLEEHQSHLTCLSEQRKEGLSQLATMLKLYLPDLQQDTQSLSPACRDPLSLIAKVTCNCFTISDGELQEIGVGLYPRLINLIDLFCHPYFASFIAVPALLCAVAGSSKCPREDKQKSVCEEQKSLQLVGERAQTATGGIRAKEMLKVPTKLLPGNPTDVYIMKAVRCRADMLVNMLSECVTMCINTLDNPPFYRQYYPDPHPVHGVQLVRVGKLQHLLGNIEEALDTFTQAYGILKVTHGNEHPITKDLLMKMEECRAEMVQQ
uniref:[histone H3]-lysine(4) N-trimethyltransferase n=1 Tax=Tetraodon nigroviridis TaxID=99883 RepID=H3C4Z6_TETNG